VNYREEDLVKRLNALAPDGIDHVADVDFAAHVALYPAFMKVGATVGAYATATNLTPEVPFYPLAFRNIAVQPFVVYSMSASAKAAAIADIGRMLAAGQLTPRIGARFAMADTAQAHEALEAGGVVGNIVVEIAAA
jgi:NADPH2:quinone reductase